MITLTSHNYCFPEHKLLEHPVMGLIFFTSSVEERWCRHTERKREMTETWEPIQTLLFTPYKAILIPISFMTVGMKMSKGDGNF